MIKLENVSKTFKIPHEKRTTLRESFVQFFRPLKYEKFWALKNVSFEVNEGEWMGIVGPNGSGKSTLLKILAGVYLPDSGKIEIKGRLVPFLELGVGFNMELSARDNIFLNGIILGMTKKEVERKFKQIVQFAGIERFLDTKLKNFSSGMQVRLAFSIAKEVEGDVYLLDEVLAVGDADFQKKCQEEFKKLKEKRKTVLIVSHELPSIDRWCDRAVWLENGQLKMIGTAPKITHAYWKSTLKNKR